MNKCNIKDRISDNHSGGSRARHCGIVAHIFRNVAWNYAAQVPLLKLINNKCYFSAEDNVLFFVSRAPIFKKYKACCALFRNFRSITEVCIVNI